MEKIMADVQMDFSSLCDRINKRDTTLCDEDWCGITNNFDLGWIEAVYKNIKADDMFDVITELICSQYATIVAKGMIDDSIPHVNEAGMVVDYPDYFLNKFRDEIRSQRAAEESERNIRYNLKQKMMKMKKEAWERTSEVPISYDSDGVPNVDEYESRLADQVEDIFHENEELSKQVENLNDKLNDAKNLDERRVEEINLWRESSERHKAEVIEWQEKFNQTEALLRKTEHERDMLKDLLNEKPGAKKFNVRQTAIIAYALCKKGEVIPRNKKSIAPMFHDLTGLSVNTIGQNLCSTYSDKELEEIAVVIENDMPEFATYLREKTFFLPEIKK